MEKFMFLPDQPIEDSLQETLGFGQFVELIQKSVYHTETPFVFGVLGDWGSGKTSILKLVEKKISSDLREGKQSFIPIWFNAWRYENESNLIYPLLYAIRRDYQERVSNIYHVKNFGEKFLKVVAISTIALADMSLRVATKHLTGEVYKLDEIAKQLKEIEDHPDKLEEVLSDWADQVRDLDDAFKQLLDKYAEDFAICDPRAKEENIQFVILIDDLDRCLPETTISILESIKNYLSVKRCIFILGMNPKVIYQGIKIKYHGLDIDGREYLEKILNYSFYVPEPDPDKLIQFTRASLEALIPENDKRSEYTGYFYEFGRKLRDCKFHNPRKIKRILNHFLIFLGSNEERLSEYNLSNMITFIILSEYFPSLFQLFLVNPELVKQDLQKLLNANPQMTVEEFEKRYSIFIKQDFPRLSQLKSLFDLHAQNDIRKPSLIEQANVIYKITHLT